MERLERLYKINFNVEKYKDYIDIILDIFDNDNLNHDLTDKNILNIIGIYYRHKIKNYDEMKKYYLMAIELKNDNAMFNLGNYYREKQNYNEMKKYYLMGIELNNADAMNNLGYYYQINEKNYNEMKKYYSRAIQLNNGNSMNNLGCYYRSIEQKYTEMKKYYLMAIQVNNEMGKINFCLHYEKYMQHYLLRQINSKIAIEKVKQLEENNFLGVKIFKELTEYCFNPQRLLKLCNMYNIELNDYMDII